MPYASTWKWPFLSQLADEQSGVVARAQLQELGVGCEAVSAEVQAQRWTTVGSRVVLLQNAPPDRRQTWWVGLLHAGAGTALAGVTALEADGLTGFEQPATHVVVARGVHVPGLQGLVVHESRRFCASDLHPTRQPPRTRVSRSAIDAAAWQLYGRVACALLAATVQQRRARPAELREALGEAGQVRHRAAMRYAIDDVEGGAHSLAEIDVGRICRRAALPPPDRQRVRRDSTGRRRYLDCEWRLADGRIVVLEVDGGLHLGVRTWWKDMVRERELVLTGRTVLRCSTVEIRLEPQGLVRDLISAGVPQAVSNLR